MPRPTLATIWLDGCSGCHMSLLDLDERLIELAALFDVVVSPLVDRKDFPEAVDVALVEGAIGSRDDLHRIQVVRARTRTLVAMGDCAITGNVPAMRNACGVDAVLQRVFHETAGGPRTGEPPTDGVPTLLARVRPIHEVVSVDVFLPGCPPPADAIYETLAAIAEGRTPDTAALTRFGK